MTLFTDGDRIGDYEVERFLGQGAFAEVYRVKHRHLRWRRAMKVFKRIGTLEETEELLDEARMLTKFKHPNIVQVFDASTVSTPAGVRGYFTMDYMPMNLYAFWRSYGNQFVPVGTTVDILHQVCLGLAAAHAEQPPIIHRDVTPMNILISLHERPQVQVSDFGLAKNVHPLTGFVSTKGNPAFKPPEALRNLQADSAASDVWAIGTMAYLLLTDRLPWADAYGPSSLFGTAHLESPNPPHKLNFEVDDGLERIVLGALEIDPKKRPQDAGVLAEELAGWLVQRELERQTKEINMVQGTSKTALSPPVPNDRDDLQALVERALTLGRQASTLPEAENLMEEAIAKDTRLAREHEHRLRMWRKGIVA